MNQGIERKRKRMYLQNDAEMVGKTLAELYLTLIEKYGFKSMHDLRKKK